MAFQMNYVDASGNDYTNSYWIVTNITINPSNMTARIVINGYKNAAAQASNLNPVGSKFYSVNSTDYTKWFASTVSPTPVLLTQIYNYARAVLDTNSASFFSGATVVADPAGA